MGQGFEKETEICEGTLSHFGLKPGPDITFVNEKISDITGPVKAGKINIINNSNVTALEEQ